MNCLNVPLLTPFVIVSLLIGTYALPADDAFDCVQLVRKSFLADRVYVGDAGRHKDKYRYLQLLGAGKVREGGKVYSVLDLETGETKVIKEYIFPHKLDNDIRAFELLSTLLGENPGETNISALIKYNKISSMDLELEYLEGQDLEKVLLKYGAAADHGAVLDRYTNLLKTIEQRLLARKDSLGLEIISLDNKPSLSTSLPSLYIDVEQNGVVFNIYLKPDNLLLTTDNRIVIIDPH